MVTVGSADGAVRAQVVDSTACGNAAPAVAAYGDTVLVAWWAPRSGPAELRVARSDDGGRTFGAPVRVSHDRWHIDGCPENGPALAVDRSGALHVMWPTLVKEKGTEVLALFHAISTDGRGVTPRVDIA